MDNPSLHYYPGSSTPTALPLARFLPPLPEGMVAAWLKENVPAGSWLLDPLGSSPALILEAARAGYRVLAACNNPIVSFMIEILASAPSSGSIQSALAELAVTKRGDERLEKHLQNLYLTHCENCGEQVPAQAFLWHKGETQPYARLYRCPHCNEAPTGERPITPFDLERLSGMGGDRLQRARALQRVIMNEDEHRGDVEEALENYLPRPLYVLFTLINKIEGLGLPPERLRLLQALLLSVFDAGNTLWPWPGGRARPRQLTIPPQFRENNLWMVLEEAAGEWAAHSPETAQAIPVTRWPELPDGKAGGAICLFHGRVKALMPLPADMHPQALLTVFPRPSQAFWTLSVLWAGWLWGAEAALPIRNVLDRRRYDWNWHTSAVHSALAAVSSNLAPETPLFGLLPELAPGFLSAVITAGHAGGLILESLAIRPEEEMAQGLWRPAANGPVENKVGEPNDSPSSNALEQAARAAMRADLLDRGEPAPYISEYAAGLWGLIKAGAVPRSPGALSSDLLTRLQAILARTFADRSFLRLYGSPAEESGWWWLAEEEHKNPPVADPANLAGPIAPAQFPLADQVEVELVRFLQKHPTFDYSELDDALCRRFPGLRTPSPELIHICLESYAETIPGQPGKWRMSASETAAARRSDLQEIQMALIDLGKRLGYRTYEHGGGLFWEDPSQSPPNRPAWQFTCMASSIISRYVLIQPPPISGQAVLVLPGSRARLLRFKLRRNPRLAEAAHHWRFLKYRHLRDISTRADMNSALWESLLDEDPLTDEATQMQLFS